jgi:hypothetical protein
MGLRREGKENGSNNKSTKFGCIRINQKGDVEYKLKRRLLY